MEASALGSLIAACPTWKRREEKRREEKRREEKRREEKRREEKRRETDDTIYATVIPCLTARIATCLLPGLCSKYPTALVSSFTYNYDKT